MDMSEGLTRELRLVPALAEEVGVDDGRNERDAERQRSDGDAEHDSQLSESDRPHGVIVVGCEAQVSVHQSRRTTHGNVPFTQTWSFLARGWGVGAAPC